MDDVPAISHGIPGIDEKNSTPDDAGASRGSDRSAFDPGEGIDCWQLEGFLIFGKKKKRL